MCLIPYQISVIHIYIYILYVYIFSEIGNMLCDIVVIQKQNLFSRWFALMEIQMFVAMAIHQFDINLLQGIPQHVRA